MDSIEIVFGAMFVAFIGAIFLATGHDIDELIDD